jgi:uncharacterized protein
MAPQTTPASFADDDLARLEALLHASPYADRALSADALQGLFVAMAMGPDHEPAEQWLQAALGDTDEERSHVEPELVGLMERFRVATAESLRDGTLALLLYPLRRGRPDYATWCQGFLLGVEIAPTDWYEAADPDDVDELLFPLRVLGDELTDEERSTYTPAAWRKLVLDSEAGFDEAIVRLRDFWSIVRSPPRTIRHAAPKVGRNEPCPCGSGRKHKHCCGR